MAYNSTTGSQMSGDIRYENDPEDTQIDFENDSIALKAGGAQRFVVNSAHITASVPISCSAAIAASTFVGDGSGLTGIATSTPGGSTTQVQYNSGGSFAGSNNFTFDGKDVKIGGVTGSLIVTGSIIASSIGAGIFTTDISGSGNASFSGFELYSAGARLAYMSGSGQISASYGITASAFYGSGASLTGLPSAAITTYNSATNNYILSAVNATTVQGEANLQFDGTTLSVTGDMSGSGVLSVDQIKCSGSVTAVSFAGDGSALTGLPSAAISTYSNASNNRVITSVNTTSVQGEADLTFDGTKLTVNGASSAINVTGSLQIGTSINTTHKLHVSGTEGDVLAVFNTNAYPLILGVSGSGKVLVGGIYTDGKLNVTGSDNDKLISVKSNIANPAFYVSGSGEAFFSGNVGIGTTSPGYDLHVNGAGVTEVAIDGGASSDAYLRFATNGVAKSYVKLGSGGALIVAQDATGGDLLLKAKPGGVATTYLTLDGSTSIITASVAISCSVGITASAFVGDGSGLTGIAGGGTPGGSDGQVQYNNGGAFGGEAELFYDDINNRLGVGTSAPNHTLSVTGSAAISGDLTVSGSLRAAKRIEMTTHYFGYGGSATTFIPFGYGNTDDATNPTGKNQFIAPYPGSLKKLMVRTLNTQNGHATASLWVGNDGTEDFFVGGSVVEHVTASMASANTTYTFNFTGTSHFTSSQIVGVAFDFRLNPGDVNMTCVWEYDDREL